VESELLDDASSLGAASPAPEHEADDVTLDAAVTRETPAAFASRANIISPQRPVASKSFEADDDGIFSEAVVLLPGHDSSLICDNDARAEISQLQVSTAMQITQHHFLVATLVSRTIFQSHVMLLEQRLTSSQGRDAASQEMLVAMQRRDEECFDLHRKLEVSTARFDIDACVMTTLAQSDAAAAARRHGPREQAPPAGPSSTSCFLFRFGLIFDSCLHVAGGLP
jgi:hypothetical protein